MKIVYIVDNDSVDNLTFDFLVKHFDQHLTVKQIDSGLKALEKLERLANTDPDALPDYLFLASETSTMTCWQFLKELEKLKLEEKKHTAIYILSSALQTDIKKHEQDIMVTGFISKPLNPQYIKQIFQL